jgi:uncharacterized protein
MTDENLLDMDVTEQRIAGELGVTQAQVHAAVELLDGGNTIPFIARYRKEATRGLDEVALRHIEDALAAARELAQRKSTILKTIDQQGLLSDELRHAILTCDDKRTLEDLYLPYKPKRRTRATIARERGLEPLADILWLQQPLAESRAELLQRFVSLDKDVPDVQAALQGACDILAERWSQDVATRDWLIKQACAEGRIQSKVRRGKEDPNSKFAMYFEHSEPVRRLPSHRLLAMKRGEAEGMLSLSVVLDDQRVLGQLKSQWITNPQFSFVNELRETVDDCYRRLLMPATESAVLQQCKEEADREAIGVFGKNLRELLLAPPAGQQVTMGIDPGFRTGCKVAIVDETGKFLAHDTIYPTPPRNDRDGAGRRLLELIARYDVKLISIGNGTASRETDAFVSELIRQQALPITKVVVSEAGASVYSASEAAAREYPELDVVVRGAISIAHRLQDPLAELVKIDPKAIGVGQYQHDVNQHELRRCLDREVESCVNSVGVDLNTSSAELLSRVAGIGAKLAENIVAYRDANGRFADRSELKKVPKLGQKAYEQAAGFLRIRGGRQPLDASAVHPESYYVVDRMARALKVSTQQLVGNATLSQRLTAADFVDEQVGVPTILDILAELAKPGRDPRREFRVATFSEDIHTMEDLQEGMVLEGVVTNVTRFGAFVDIGVHQDGLIHISELASRYVEDPGDVVSLGEVVRVKVIAVDVPRKRISLSRKQVSG